MTILSSKDWADAIESAESLILRWGHGQVRAIPDTEVERIVAALRAPVSERGTSEAPHISASGFRVRLHGSTGACMDLVCFADPTLPDDVVELRDPHSGRVLGKIINVGHE